MKSFDRILHQDWHDPAPTMKVEIIKIRENHKGIFLTHHVLAALGRTSSLHLYINGSKQHMGLQVNDETRNFKLCLFLFIAYLVLHEEKLYSLK